MPIIRPRSSPTLATTKPDTRALTGLRGVAALWVAVHHLSGNLGQGAAANLIVKGYLAVDLFFVLSGFVIALNHAGRFSAARGSADLLAFYGLRVARVLPPLLAAIGLTLAVRLGHGAAPPTPQTLVANVAMIQAWFGIPAIVPASWSISTEVFAYLCFPWIAGFALRRGALGLALAIAGAWACLFAMTMLDPATWFGQLGLGGPLDIHRGQIFPLVRCLAGFVVGVCAWRLAQHPGIAAGLASRFVPEAIILAVVALCWRGDGDLLIAMLMPLLVTALAQPRHLASAILRTRLAMALGAISYPLYLCHLVVGIEVRNGLLAHGLVEPVLLVVAPCAASLAAAAALHRLVERPCHDLLARWRTRPPRPAAVSMAADPA